ncbi:CCA tRNA nucleotidyltransferase [Shimia haliotis]|uniref:Poly(A) polymerase n=1 Tax=Shimia haliotis TaxID=1280847 RepID=A0A1I4EIY5_9RHOB|nr:CCA tRNA nucleotidyltransferase [Shimia haliotis]SFL05702.1 poly(A) polymerase [Shimia haliotis]
MKVVGDWLTNPATQKVCKALTDAGYQALFVGGCVRNALLGAPVNDIDISTDALPERVMELAKSAGLNAVPTGIEHGTITVVSNHIPHEITTFRRDVETDGRRAVVAFSDNVEDDALRRDFTMNALYATPDGTVVDPLGGMTDLKARRLRFIDNAEDRIREDYLRILRYFRFHAIYGDPMAGMDPDALAAIADNIDGLATLSKERVGTEVKKLLSASDPAPAVAAMRSTGVLTAILHGCDDKALAPLVHLEAQFGLAPDPIRRLASLGGVGLTEALRLSKRDSRSLYDLRDGVENTMGPAELGYRLGSEAGTSILLLRAAMLELPFDPASPAEVSRGAAADFPIRPADLMPDYSGPALGRALKTLESRWIESGLTMGKAALLATLTA